MPGHTPGAHQPGTSPNTPGTPGTPNNPATPQNPQNSPASTPANPAQQAQPTPVPVHTVTTTPAPTPQPATPDAGTQHTGGTPDRGNDNTTDNRSEPPPPASATRDNTPPGGVNDPSRAEQNALDNAVPRDENGDPTRPPDPDDGNWVERINGAGPDAPGRSNNCVDTALSTVDTFSGNPTAAGARTPDLDADGNPSDRGERGGRDRIENALGARFNDMGNGRDAYNRLENTLRTSGHGSQAVIITQDANGRAHAWNAVNHNGRITYIDAQTGQRSPHPLHSGRNGVFAIPLDPDRRPVAAGGDTRGNNPGRQQERTPDKPTGQTDRRGPSDPDSPDADRRTTDPTPERPAEAEGERRPHAEPAGQPSPDKNAEDDGPDAKKPDGDDPDPQGDPKKKDPDDRPYTDPYDRGTSDTADESRRLTEDGPQSGGSRTHAEPESTTSREYGLEPDTLQQNLRGNRDVHRVELDRVHERLEHWAGSGELARVLQATSGEAPHPDGPKGLRRFTQEHLSNNLDGFGQLSRGEQQAVVASLARLSLSFHQQHSVGRSPEGIDLPYRQPNEPDPEPGTKDRGAKNSKQSLGVRLHRRFVNGFFGSGELKNLPEAEAKALKRHGPDFSDKNFAVLEVQGPPPKNEISYVVDSSVPANLPGVTPRHSERHLIEWLERVDPSGENYKPVGLYTEREPCGEGQGHMKCSEVLQHERLADTPIHYSATYRDDPAGVAQRNAMLPAKQEAMAAVDDMTHQEIKDELKRRVDERLVPHSSARPKNFAKIDGLSEEDARKALRTAIKNEHDRMREQVDTYKELARDAEMTRHMEALRRTWDALRPSLTS